MNIEKLKIELFELTARRLDWEHRIRSFAESDEPGFEAKDLFNEAGGLLLDYELTITNFISSMED